MLDEKQQRTLEEISSEGSISLPPSIFAMLVPITGDIAIHEAFNIMKKGEGAPFHYFIGEALVLASKYAAYAGIGYTTFSILSD